MDIGFIGIGSMGAAMVPRLVEAGHRIRVWNRTRAAAEALSGVEVVDTPIQAFAGDAVLTMLADDAAVRSAVLESQALAAARPGLIHASMSTISPGLVGELAERHRAAGVEFVAAPVFGVPAVAARGELNIVAAGPRAAIAALEPLFELLGRKTWPVGEDPVRAAVAKVAGNMMIALAIESMGEASALTEIYGLKGGDFLEIMTSTLFAGPVYQRYGGLIARQEFEPGFKLSLGLKDVTLALDAAQARGTSLPALAIVRRNLLAALDQGLGSKDFAALAQTLRHVA